MKAPDETAPRRFVRRVEVEGLFGQFDHDLSFGEHIPDHPNLLILYGENGTGKTTILWMLYHLLNKEGKQGHRTYLANQQFRKFAVTFSDGLEISAVREIADSGSFEMRIAQNATPLGNFKYEVDGTTGRIPPAATDDPFLELLPNFNFGFLPRDRSTRFNPVGRRGRRPRIQSRDLSPIRNVIIGAIANARQQGISASNQGQLTVNAIYTELVRQIAEVPLVPPESGVDEGSRLRLLNRLQDQARITSDYSKFGLTSELQVEGLLDILRTMPATRIYIVDTVLKPFLQGNEARLQALEGLYIALTTAVESMNSMYLNKQIAFHLESGVKITGLSGEVLRPEQLSSGEQELLILFCEVISASMPDTILFIDEPELSLNVSWQRKLLGSLLKCAGSSTIQFVIATHSIEILAQYRSNVARLSNRVGNPPRLDVTDEKSQG